MAKINLNRSLVNYFVGENFKNDKGQEQTAKELVCQSLYFAQAQGREDIPQEDKYKLYDIALRIQNSKKEVELNSEEISLVKTEVSKGMQPIVYGQIVDMLENKERNTK